MKLQPHEAARIDVVSDVVCPWCFIGKRRLEKAIAPRRIPLEVRWHPFQLDPTIPPEGKDRRDYLEAKFGTGGADRGAARPIAASRAREEGIDFAFDRIEVSPNTLDAHRLIRWAAAEGKQEAHRGRAVPRLLPGRPRYRRPCRCSPISPPPSAWIARAVAARLASDEDRAGGATGDRLGAADRRDRACRPSSSIGRYGSSARRRRQCSPRRSLRPRSRRCPRGGLLSFRPEAESLEVEGNAAG